MAKKKADSPEEAFQKYLADAIVRQALTMVPKASLTENLLRDCFMRGAGYAIERCKAEHHQTRKD